MKRETKEFFKNYSDDFRFSKDINDIKKNIEFAQSNQKSNGIGTIFTLKHVLIVLVTILMVAPISIYFGHKIVDNSWTGVKDPSEDKYVIQQIERRFDKYLEHSVESLIVDDNVEIAFYLGIKNNKVHLLTYAKSNTIYVINILEVEEIKGQIDTSNRQIYFFELDDAIFQLKLQIQKDGVGIEEKVIDFDLTEYIKFLQTK